MGALVVAVYRPKPEGEERLRGLIARHVPTLRRRGLATERPVLLMRSRTDGTYLEIFEWVTSESAQVAHHDEAVREIWDAMSACADLLPLSALSEASRPFPHFEPVDGLTA